MNLQRVSRTAKSLEAAYFNPAVVARNRSEESRTWRGKMFWLLVGQMFAFQNRA